MAKRAIISGITGQDGSYLAELLLDKGYEVTGIVRRSSSPNMWRIEHLLDRITLRPADLLDQLSLMRVIQDVQPHEFYNLAAMSFVPASWDQPMLTGDFNSQGVTRLLEAVRQVNPKIRLYQASSSEMYGRVREVPQTEMTPFYPRSPYGVSKVFGHYITVNYRESYDMFAVSGILFNHESPRRGLEFVTRKVTDGVARDQAREGRPPGARQPRRAARLGLCRRLRARDVADAAAGHGRRLRDRHRRQRTRCSTWWKPPSSTSGSTGRSTCAPIRAFLRPAEVDHADWRCVEGQGEAGLEAGRQLRAAVR